MAKVKTVYYCKECGNESIKWVGRCSACGEWNTLVEEVKVNKTEKRGYLASTTATSKLITFDEVDIMNTQRIQTSMTEFNSLLGGGLVPGSFILIAGEPGVGKSTLFMQLLKDLGEKKHSVVYISGEESPHQLKSRAQRLDALHSGIRLFPETDLSIIATMLNKERPEFVVIDSIQTIYKPEVTSAPGSQTQVKECAAEIMKICKTLNICALVVAQFVKSNEMAGPKALEHLCDTTLYFEGERFGVNKLLYSKKNRFGPLGIMVMRHCDSGLVEVTNPSEIFLEDRVAGNPGTSVTSMMEGNRALLVEIQALLTPTNFGNARRTTSGIETNRLNICAAILERHAGLKLQMQDIYVKVIGGLKLDDPCVDLALAMAVTSSFRMQPLAAGDLILGEVGLTGEIRRVSRVEERVKEAQKLGFTRAIIPRKNLAGVKFPEGIEVIGVDTIGDAIRTCFPPQAMSF